MSEVTTQSTNIALLPPAERAIIVLESKKAEVQIKEIMAESAEIKEVKDKATREQAHRAGMKLKTARTSIEKVGKAARDDANAFSKAVIEEEKRLKGIMAAEEDRIFKLRDEFDAEEQRKKDEVERIERERVEGIKVLIAAIKALPLQSAGDSAEMINATYSDLQEMEISVEDFSEFTEEAISERQNALQELLSLYNTVKTREEAAKIVEEERQRLEADRKAEEERQAAERARLKEEADKLAAERLELERLRAEIEAAKNPAAVVITPFEPEIADDPAVNETPIEETQDQEPVVANDNEPETMSVEESAAFISGLEEAAAEQISGLADKLDAVMPSAMADQLRSLAGQVKEGQFKQQIMLADWNAIANADRRMGEASFASITLIEGDQLQAAE